MANEGLQCGLSGNPVSGIGDDPTHALMGNRQTGDGWQRVWKADRT